jgi:hypothetical protein
MRFGVLLVEDLPDDLLAADAGVFLPAAAFAAVFVRCDFGFGVVLLDFRDVLPADDGELVPCAFSI